MIKIRNPKTGATQTVDTATIYLAVGWVLDTDDTTGTGTHTDATMDADTGDSTVGEQGKKPVKAAR